MSKLLVLGDTHFGEKELSPVMVNAVTKAFAFGIDHDTEVASAGDYTEAGEVADRLMQRRAMRQVLGGMLQYQSRTKRPIHVVPGNHERYLHLDHLRDIAPGIEHELHPLMYEKDGVVLHHGDLADTKVRPLTAHLDTYKGSSTAELKDFLENDPEFAADRQAYHARNMIFVWDWMRLGEKIGFSNMRQLQLFDWIARGSISRSIQAALADNTLTRQAGADFVLNTWLAEQMPDAWAVLSGHTHMPNHTSWVHDATGRQTIIANVGSIYSTARAPTSVLLDTSARTSTMLAFRDDEWRAESVIKHGDPKSFFMPATHLPKPKALPEGSTVLKKVI